MVCKNLNRIETLFLITRNKSGGDLVFGGNAKVNATIGAKTIYDLTDEGVELFFVLGRKGEYENRGFHNLLTQGSEGYQKTSEKILKTDITQVETIERPSSKGSIKFDTVQWNKDKTVIKGTLEEKIYKTKSWITAWEEETLSKPALVVIGVAAAVGGGLYGANLATTLGAAGKAMTSAGFATLCSTAATSFAATEGDFEKTFKALMSDQTAKSLAVNITTAGVTQGIIDQLGLHIDPKTWTGQLQHNAIQGGVRGTLDMAVLGEKPDQALKTAVIHTAVNTVAGKLASDTGVGKTGKIALQTTAGGITGALMDGKTEDIINGAVSGLTAALVSDALEKKPEQKAVEKKKEDTFKTQTLITEQEQKEVAQEIEAIAKERQEIREKAKQKVLLLKQMKEKNASMKASRTSLHPEVVQDYVNKMEDLSYESIAKEMIQEDQKVIETHQKAIESKGWSSKLKDVFVKGCKQEFHEMRTYPYTYAKNVAKGLAYFAGDLVVPGGLEASEKYFKGDLSLSEAIYKQGQNFGMELLIGGVVGKIGKGAKGLIDVAKKAVIKGEQKEAEKIIAKETTHILENVGKKDVETLEKKLLDTEIAKKYDVGEYNELRKTFTNGLDAHHVGQKAVMKKFIPGYDPTTAPAILVDKVGHTIKGPNGIVSRNVEGLQNARSVIARDIQELRRVYPDIPNSKLQELIQLNKNKYKEVKDK